MRKVNLIILALILGVFVFSCKPKDETNPKIFLNGDSLTRVVLQTYYDDEGAYADDNFDGPDITSTISIVYDIPGIPSEITDWKNLEGWTNKTGIYSVTYSVTDKAGHTTTLDRVVDIYNQAEKYAVNYSVDKSSDNQMTNDYTGVSMTVSTDSKVNNRIVFPKLSKISGLKIFGNIRDSVTTTSNKKYIDIPYQEKVGIMENGDTCTFIILGVTDESYFIDTTFFFKFRIKYQIDIQGTPQNDIVTEIYTKI